jgi:4-amino-4-deoxy-L-arabinose transferase-like glycosyltransferase
MAILSIVSIALAFFFVKNMAGRIAAYLWVGFAAVSPYFLLQTRRAMAESPLLFFTMLALLFCYLGIKKIEHDSGKIHPKALVYLVGSSICIAFAGESKMNGLVILAGVILCVVLVIFKQKDSTAHKMKRSFFISTLLTFVTAIVFLVLYPYLWPSPLGRTQKMFEDRITEMREQTVKHAPDKIDTLQKRLTIIPWEIFENYAVIHFNGSLFINIILLLIGLTVIASQALNWFRQTSGNAASIVLLTSSILASIPAFFTLLDWDRYYLFPVFFSTIFIAIALDWMSGRVFEWVAPKFPRRVTT